MLGSAVNHIPPPLSNWASMADIPGAVQIPNKLQESTEAESWVCPAEAAFNKEPASSF